VQTVERHSAQLLQSCPSTATLLVSLARGCRLPETCVRCRGADRRELRALAEDWLPASAANVRICTRPGPAVNCPVDLTPSFVKVLWVAQSCS
jgi:hypothetical protein